MRSIFTAASDPRQRIYPTFRELASFGLLSLALALPWARPAHAADPSDPSAARAQYEKERARCNTELSGPERDTCLQSAGAAYDEAKAGKLDTAPHPFVENRIDRCTPLPPAERDDCIRRMQGAGVTSGSVQGGGIYRETDTMVITPAPAARPTPPMNQ
ncbi:MAG: hypothetical protein ABSF50_16115 [Burkholderiaceae bacterium]|jgi:hypothetical protein